MQQNINIDRHFAEQNARWAELRVRVTGLANAAIGETGGRCSIRYRHRESSRVVPMHRLIRRWGERLGDISGECEILRLGSRRGFSNARGQFPQTFHNSSSYAGEARRVQLIFEFEPCYFVHYSKEW